MSFFRRVGIAGPFFLLVFGLGTAVCFRSGPAAESGPSTATPAGAAHAASRVILIGLDGADWDILDPLITQGRLPNLSRLAARGARGILDAPEPLLSPPLWTTIATGVPPDEHGILDFMGTDASTGSIRPVSSGDRTAPALWNMASAMGVTVGCVGWWATWPAEAVNGAMVSDRMTDILMPSAGDGRRMIYPPAFGREAGTLRTDPSTIPPALAGRFIDIDEAEWKASWAFKGYDHPVSGLRHILASTLTTQRLALRVEAAYHPRLLMVYFEGTDTIGHLFAPYAPPRMERISRADFRRYSRAVTAYYEWVDELLGDFLSMADKDTTMLVVSDHGFSWGEERPEADASPHGATAVWWHRKEGIFLAGGVGVRPSASGRLTPCDICPTVLALLGLGASPAMKGRVPAWAFAAGSPGVPDLPRVDYARLWSRGAAGAESVPAAERQALEAKLKALGYLSGGVQGSRTDPLKAQASEKLDSRRLNNLGASLLQRGEADAAEKAYLRAAEADPENPNPKHNLMLLYLKQGDDDRAERYFWDSVEAGLPGRETAIVEFALDLEEKDRIRGAADVFRKGLRRFPESYTVCVNAGAFFASHGELAEAESALRRAVMLNPTSAAALANLGSLLIRRGQAPEAVPLIRRSLELKADQPDLRVWLRAYEDAEPNEEPPTPLPGSMTTMR
jgi:Flp pilus assembly protein TadD